MKELRESLSANSIAERSGRGPMVGKNSPLAGIQTLPDNFVLALGTLASGTTVLVNANYGTALTRSFLMKRIRLQGSLTTLNAADGIIIGFAKGDMTIAQIAAALEADINDPNDFDSWASMIQRRGIMWQSLHSVAATGTNASQINMDVGIGGKKGIPMTAGEGVVMFAHNPHAAAMTTGSLLAGLFQIVGVWLDEIVAGA